jgi:hypothetical protein
VSAEASAEASVDPVDHPDGLEERQLVEQVMAARRMAVEVDQDVEARLERADLWIHDDTYASGGPSSGTSD